MQDIRNIYLQLTTVSSFLKISSCLLFFRKFKSYKHVQFNNLSKLRSSRHPYADFWVNFFNFLTRDTIGWLCPEPEVRTNTTDGLYSPVRSCTTGDFPCFLFVTFGLCMNKRLSFRHSKNFPQLLRVLVLQYVN